MQGGTGTTRHIDGLLPALGEGCRLVHRLDRDTSGVLVIAKNVRAAKWAGRAFQSRRAEKVYWGITNGVPKPSAGEIKGYMAKGCLDNRFGNKHEGKEVMEAVRHGAPGAKPCENAISMCRQSGPAFRLGCHAAFNRPDPSTAPAYAAIGVSYCG